MAQVGNLEIVKCGEGELSLGDILSAGMRKSKQIYC